MITTEPVFATVKFNSVHKYRSATGIKCLRGIKNILLDQTFPLSSRCFICSLENNQKWRTFLVRRKINHSPKNKTHKKLTAENLYSINAPVTEITVFETSEGIGERSREALGESKGRAVCSC